MSLGGWLEEVALGNANRTTRTATTAIVHQIAPFMKNLMPLPNLLVFVVGI